MKYLNGRSMSPLVFQSVRYVTKTGVITRQTWNELFCKGTDRWKRKQLRHMIELGIFRSHPCDELVDTFIMGRMGHELAKDEKWNPVYYIQPQFVKHDETVSKGLWLLESSKLCQGWMTERELKGQKSQLFKLNVREQGGKYPDGVFKLQSGHSSEIISVEYERSGKTNWRYNKAIKAYSESGEFQKILYIVESRAIEESIKRGMVYIGDASLNSRIGFISVDEWKQSPINASIRGLKQGGSIADLVRIL